VQHVLRGQQVLRDRRGERVELDAGVAAAAITLLGREHRNRPLPMPGSRMRPPLKPKRVERRPHAAHDRLARVVRVLRRAHRGGEFVLGEQRLGALGERLPGRRRHTGIQLNLAGLPVLRRAEQVLRDFGRAPSGELGELCLLFRGGLSLFGFELVDDLDDVEIARRGVAPRAFAGERAFGRVVVGYAGGELSSSLGNSRTLASACSWAARNPWSIPAATS
jgi:hypothetical protein